MNIDETTRKVAEYQAGHAIMSYDECLAWVEEEKARSMMQDTQCRIREEEKRPVSMEDFLEAAE